MLPPSCFRKGRVVVEVMESLVLVLVKATDATFGGRPLPRFNGFGGGGDDFGVSSVVAGSGFILVLVSADAEGAFFFVGGEG